MSQTRFTCLLALLLVPVAGFSASPLSAPRALNFAGTSLSSLPIYGSVSLDVQSIGISDSEFTTPLITAAAGWWGWPGIGFELELGTSLADDSLNNLDVEVSSYGSLSVRLESPPIDQIAVYVVFGASRTNIDSRFSGDVVNRKQNSFNGARAALGLTFKVNRQLAIDTGFTRHEYDDDIRINSFRLGLRYDFAEGGR